jgi:hypothetical protein
MKTRIKIKIIILVTGVLIMNPLRGQDARQIADQASKSINLDAMEMVATLKILDDKGNERVRQIATVTKRFDDATKTMMKFISPADVKGTTMLVYDYDKHEDDMWIYLPALRKTRRIVSSEKAKSFMGSEFSNADMSKPNMDDFSYRILGSASIVGKDCWKVETKCLNEDIEDENGFSRKVIYVEKSSYLPQKIEYFNFDDELFKVMTISDYQKQSNGSYFAYRMTVENLQNNRKSIMVVDKFQLGSSMNESSFAASNLGT